MNNKLKRSIAVVLTAAAICNSLGTTTGFSKININSVVASAADVAPQTSGTTNKYFYYHADGYSLYFSVTSSSAKTATLTGCTTNIDSVYVNIPETVNYNGNNYTITKIGENAFRNQTRICSVSGMKYVTEIGSYAFAGCEKLGGFYPDWTDTNEKALNIIRNNAFMNCRKLNTTSFLGSVKTIESHAFENCESITDVSTSELTTMGSYAFAKCYRLTNINLKNSTIKTIPEYAFAYTGVSKTDEELVIGLPSTVQTIGNYAFYDAQRLEFINISNVTNIGDMAFTYCWKLKTVLTSDNLSKIGGNAFNCCDSLEFFVCKNPNVSIGSGAFGYRQGSREIDIVLWGSNGGGNVKKYAANNGLTYKNTEDAALHSEKEIEDKYKKYMWQIRNSESDLGDKNGNKLYNDKHKEFFEISNSTKFSGACYGLATISTLVHNGDINVNSFAKGYSDIFSITKNCSLNIKSFINAMAASQSRGAYDYNVSGKFDVKGKDAELLKYIEYINYGADAGILCYTALKDTNENGITKSVGHAVVCYGMQDRDDADDKNSANWGKEYDKRILLYDVNYSYFTYNKCIYIDSETGNWKMVDTRGNTKVNDEFDIIYKLDTMFPERNGLNGLDLVKKLIRLAR